MGAVDPQRVHHSQDQGDLPIAGVGGQVCRPLGVAEAVEIDGPHSVGRAERGYHFTPRVAGGAKTVEEQHGLALPGLLDVHQLAPDAHELALRNFAADAGERPVGSAAGEENRRDDRAQEENEEGKTHGGEVYTAPALRPGPLYPLLRAQLSVAGSSSLPSSAGQGTLAPSRRSSP